MQNVKQHPQSFVRTKKKTKIVLVELLIYFMQIVKETIGNLNKYNFSD